jgi:hypothetical protein
MIIAVVILAVLCILLINYVGVASQDCVIHYSEELERCFLTCGGGSTGFNPEGFVANGSFVYG